jgi:hypothetical protein
MHPPGRFTVSRSRSLPTYLKRYRWLRDLWLEPGYTIVIKRAEFRSIFCPSKSAALSSYSVVSERSKCSILARTVSGVMLFQPISLRARSWSARTGRNLGRFALTFGARFARSELNSSKMEYGLVIKTCPTGLQHSEIGIAGLQCKALQANNGLTWVKLAEVPSIGTEHSRRRNTFPTGRLSRPITSTGLPLGRAQISNSSLSSALICLNSESYNAICQMLKPLPKLNNGAKLGQRV